MKPQASLISRRRALFSLVALGALATPAFAARATLSGRIFFRERMALPPKAMVEVRLVDVSLADAPARTIARTRFAAEGRNPLPFVIGYDPARIDPRRRYALQARITDGRRPLFVSTEHYPVLAGGKPDDRPLEIRVQRTGHANAAPTPQPKTPEGKWLLEDLGGRGVLDRVQTTMEVAADGRVTGTGGCNRYNGQAKIAGPALSVGPVMSTRMACSPAAMDQEARFFDVLIKVKGWRIDPARRKLYLLGPGGAPLATLSAM